MKGHKGEVVKLSQVKGGSASGEREPLFPRLHVNETEKAGPKAPPRNKMALYEQFTVPSHRFLQPTQASPATAFQQPYGSGYPYIPYYIPSVQYTTNNSTVQAYSRPSQVTSCSGITSGSVVVNQESRKAPRLHNVGSLSPCKVSRGLTEASADCMMSDVAEQRGNGAKKICGSLALNDIGGNIPAAKERRHISDRTERLHEAVSTMEQGKEGIHKRSDSSRVDDMADNERTKCLSGDVSILGRLTETLTKETNQDALAKSLREKSESKHNCASQAIAALGQCVMQSVTSFEPRNSEESGALLSMDGEYHGSALTFNESLRIQSLFNSLQSSVLDTKEDGISKLAVLGKPEVGSSEKLNAIQDKEREVSQSACREGHPDIAADSATEIKPRDVILAIGQQHFWKARKTLLRQQRIFSDQVFQLHKLITIQHLLAEASGTLIDDAVHFETVGECDAAAKKTFSTDDFACKGSDSKKRSKSQSVNTEVPPVVSRDDKKEVNTSVSELTHGGVNAWGYPSFGHWIGPGAPQGKPFSYQPLAGTLPPGSVGLPYGSAVPGLAAPMVSFGIPYCGQRQEFSAEMGSNYGPATISKCDGSGFVSRNFGHFSNDLAASWYLMQQNSLNNQMLQSCKDAPTGSGASVNKVVPGTAVQHVKTTCFPGLTYQSGLNSQSVTEGLESSAQQSDISSPSIATRLNCSVTHLKPSVQAAKKPGLTTHKEAQGVAQNFDGGIAYPSHSSNSRRSLDKNYVDARQCSMDQKEGGSTPLDEDELVDASVHSSDLGNGALELFPLVPSLSSRGQNGERDLRSVDCVQGLVIRAVPRRAVAASESAAEILLSLQQERQK